MSRKLRIVLHFHHHNLFSVGTDSVSSRKQEIRDFKPDREHKIRLRLIKDVSDGPWPKEVRALIKQWEGNPIWDIERKLVILLNAKVTREKFHKKFCKAKDCPFNIAKNEIIFPSS